MADDLARRRRHEFGHLVSLPFLLVRDRLVAAELDRGGVLMSNLAAFADESTSLPMVVALSSVDVFALWSMVLLTIGYSIAGHVTKLRAAVCVAAVWLAWIAGSAGLVALA